MKTNSRRLQPRFARETRYEVVPAPAVPFRVTADGELEQLKLRLLRQALASAEDMDLQVPLRRAANEAATLAWMTPFPLLFLPTLFEEKQAAALLQAARQRKVRARSRELVDMVA